MCGSRPGRTVDCIVFTSRSDIMDGRIAWAIAKERAAELERESRSARAPRRQAPDRARWSRFRSAPVDPQDPSRWSL